MSVPVRASAALAILLVAATGGHAQGPDATAGHPAPVNPYNGMQRREEVFEFTQKPDVRKEGEKWIITFASKANCDATVAIVDKDGRIVRHLASGLLGKNAPWPFQQNSLSQTIEWDGKDDRGRPASAGCKVKVGLGLKATYDRVLGWEPRAIAPRALICDAEGNVYVVPWRESRTDLELIVLDRQGHYVRTMLPPPAHVPPEKLTNLTFTRAVDGRQVPVPRDGYGTLYTSGPPRQTMAITPDGRTLLMVTSGHRNGRFFLRFGTDGSVPQHHVACLNEKAGGDYQKGGITGSQDLHMALSPDGQWIYFGNSASHRRNQCVVFRARLADLKPPADKNPWRFGTPPEVFVGELGKPGSDEKHFKDPRGVACDKDGNLYVSDNASDRIQVFSPDGRLLRSIAAEDPEQIAVHPSTGAIYVLRVPTRPGDARIQGDGKRHALVKLDRDGKAVCEIPVKHLRAYDARWPGVFCLDATAEEPVLWIGDRDGIHKVVDRGGKLEKVLSVGEDITAAHPGVPAFCPSYTKVGPAADPFREEVYVPTWSRAGWLRLDGRTGRLIEVVKSVRGISEMCVGPDRLVYARIGGAGSALVRFNPADGKPVPFEKGRATCRYPEFGRHEWTPSIRGQETNCIEIPTQGGGRTFQDGFCVAPNGDIYVVATEGHPSIIPRLRRLGQGEKLKPGRRLPVNLLVVYGPDGSRKHLSALPGLPVSEGIRVARGGDVYVSVAVRPTGRKEPDGIAPRMPFQRYWGTLFRLESAFNTFPVGVVHGPYEGKQIDRPSHTNGRSKLLVEGARWQYAGVAPAVSYAGSCVCANSRLDLDGFERAFVPAMQTYSVNVLDANGNLIAQIGSYGNADSRGTDSPVVDPKTGLLRPKRPDDPADLKPPKELAERIGFRWAPFVAVTDEALYALDYGARRVVRCALSYHTEEAAPVP